MSLSNKNKKEKLSRGKKFFWSITIAVLFLLVVGFLLSNLSPKSELATESVGDKVKVDSELIISFDWPFSRQIELEITPSVYGEIRYEDMLFNDHFARQVVFKPELTWLPDTTYQVKISNIKSAFPTYRTPKEQILIFTTEAPPNITSVLPSQEETIRADSNWQVGLNKINNGLIAYEFEFEPTIDVTMALDEDKMGYSIQPTSLLSQGQTFNLEILKKIVRYHFGTEEIAYQSEPESIWKGSWQVREAPGIESFEPQGNNVSLNDEIVIAFDENIDFDSFQENVTIEPALEGTWQTEDYKTVSFAPDELVKDTTYTVTLKAGLHTFEGGYLAEDSVHNFTTLGPVKLSSSSPASGSQGISINSSVRILLNQAVDHDSAESNFSVSPEVSGSFTWDGNTMIFQPAEPFTFNITYTVILAAGIDSISGHDSEEEIIFNFATELSVTKLNVAFHRQEHNLSCEIATLVMALSFRGVNVSEAAIIKAIGVDPTPKSDGVWGNPHVAFVGDIDGRQPSTGYGVYWQPIATAAQAYREASWFTGWNLSHLTAEIKKGNPVIVWGTAGSGTRIDWKTTEGGNVVAVNGEHTRLVIGFIGSADNPTKIITLDPLSGEKYFTKSSFLWNWGLLGNSGVVVE
jgi:uncharacterized protein YvpB